MKKSKLIARFASTSWNAEVVLLLGPWEEVEPWIAKNVVNERKEELLKHVQEDQNKPGYTNLGRTFFLDGGGSLIWMEKENMPILVHEIVHAVHHCLVTKDTPLSQDTEEAYAYLTEHLYKSLAAE